MLKRSILSGRFGALTGISGDLMKNLETPGKTGRVGRYGSIKFKWKRDIEGGLCGTGTLVDWFFPFKNREILFGTSIGLKVFSNWLQRVEDLLSEVAASWDGMLILADDVNTIIIHLNISQFLIG